LRIAFSRPSQRGAVRPYVTGLLSDSSRKSIESMWARLSDLIQQSLPLGIFDGQEV
jgi:hypothetical protein